MVRFWRVATVVLALLLVGGCSSAAPEATRTGPRMTIPADFPLDAGWPPDSAGGKRETPTGKLALDLCGIKPWAVPHPAASRRLVLNLDQRYRERTLILYRNASDAEGVLDGVQNKVNECTRTMAEDGTWLYGDAYRTSDGVLQIRRWFEEPGLAGDPGCFSMDLYRKGNAVLVSSDAGVGTGKGCADLAGAVDARDVVPAWEALHIFRVDDDRSATPAPAARVVDEATGFSTDNGNIGCYIDPESVRCDIALRNWDAPPAPASCMWEWGTGITLGGSGKSEFTCAGDTTLNTKNPLRPGQAFQSQHVFCRVTFNSVRCVHRSSKHGFFMARASYKLF